MRILASGFVEKENTDHGEISRICPASPSPLSSPAKEGESSCRTASEGEFGAEAPGYECWLLSSVC
jgi:hypothetical protein